MNQVNSVKELRDEHAKCLVQNRGQTNLTDINSSSYSRPRTTRLKKTSFGNTFIPKVNLYKRIKYIFCAL